MSKKLDQDRLDELAQEAMKSILIGLHSNPIMFEIMDSLAKEQKHSINQEIAERSYLIATAMLKCREKRMKGGFVE